MLSNAVKKELVQGLLDIFQNDISKIILYGSVARGEAIAASDIDIAIIVKKDMDEITRNKFINWSADMDIRHDRVFSIIDIQEEKIRKWGNILPFYKIIQKEGVVLWEAA